MEKCIWAFSPREPTKKGTFIYFLNFCLKPKAWFFSLFSFPRYFILLELHNILIDKDWKAIYSLDVLELCYHLANSLQSLGKNKSPCERFKKRDVSLWFYAETRNNKPDSHITLKERRTENPNSLSGLCMIWKKTGQEVQ